MPDFTDDDISESEVQDPLNRDDGEDEGIEEGGVEEVSL